MANSLDRALKVHSEAEAKKVLMAEGRRLKLIALKIWRKTIHSYSVKKYVRTRKAQNSIKLGKVKMIAPNVWGIELTWDNDLVYHDSIFKGKQKKGHAVMLISEGWYSAKLEKRMGRRIDRFTYFGGTGYLASVVKEWQSSAPKGVTIETQWSGKKTK